MEQLTYYATAFPPQIFAGWELPVELSSAEVSDLCEGLRAEMHRLQGQAIYLPDLEHGNWCRFEWHGRFRHCRFGVRLGISLMVTPQGATTIRGYAALNVPGLPEDWSCPGDLTCSECDALHFGHNLRGDRASIEQLLSDTIGVDWDAATRKRVKKVLGRVYREHRSSFVHAARLKHDEYHQRAGVPAVAPAGDRPWSGRLQDQHDASVFRGLVGQWLVHRIAARAGREVPAELFPSDPFRRATSPLISGS